MARDTCRSVASCNSTVPSSDSRLSRVISIDDYQDDAEEFTLPAYRNRLPFRPFFVRPDGCFSRFSSSSSSASFLRGHHRAKRRQRRRRTRRVARTVDVYENSLFYTRDQSGFFAPTAAVAVKGIIDIPVSGLKSNPYKRSRGAAAKARFT